MDSQEAIDRIKDHMFVHKMEEQPYAIYITEALRLGTVALKKQIPMRYRNAGVHFFCDECGAALARYMNFCPNCGQAVKWND